MKGESSKGDGSFVICGRLGDSAERQVLQDFALWITLKKP